MKRRYSINDAGMLVDRDGEVLGRVTAITIETERGAKGGSPSTSSKTKAAPVPPNVEEIWAEYVEVLGASRQTLNAQRKRDIANALKVMLARFSQEASIDNPIDVERRAVDRIKLAIRGLSVSPHHNGENDTGTKYLDIRYALRGNSRTGESNEERIDRMCDIAERRGQRHAGNSASASDVRIQRLVDQVQAALAQPDSETALERGRDAKNELEGMGFKVKKQGTRVWVERG